MPLVATGPVGTALVLRRPEALSGALVVRGAEAFSTGGALACRVVRALCGALVVRGADALSAAAVVGFGDAFRATELRIAAEDGADLGVEGVDVVDVELVGDVGVAVGGGDVLA